MTSKAQVSHLVEIISIVAALVVLLAIVFPVLKEALFETGERGQCNWSFMTSKLTLQSIPPECKANRITIDNSMISSRLSKAEKAVKEYQKELNPANQLFNNQNLPEWALNSVVADEIIDCSDKVLHGKLDLFSGNTASSKIICVVCSRIRFAKDLPLTSMKLESGYVDTLNPWLKVNNYKGKSYYDYIGVNKKDSPAFVYSPLTDYAIVYWEHAPSYLGTYVKTARENPWLRNSIATVTAGIGAVSLLTPVGWTYGLIAAAGAATTGFTAGTYFANVALGVETDIGNTNKAIILTPYDESLIAPQDKGGIGCEQIID